MTDDRRTSDGPADHGRTRGGPADDGRVLDGPADDGLTLHGLRLVGRSAPAALSCGEVRDRLLDMDIGRIRTGHPVRIHAEGCASCGRALDRLIADARALEAALDRLETAGARLSDARAVALAEAGIDAAARDGGAAAHGGGAAGRESGAAGRDGGAAGRDGGAAGRDGGAAVRSDRRPALGRVAAGIVAAAAVLAIAVMPLWRAGDPSGGSPVAAVGVVEGGGPRGVAPAEIREPREGAPDAPSTPRAPREPRATGAEWAAGTEPGGFSVEVPTTGRVAVFATRNPRIRVVWYYGTDSASGEGQ